MADPEGHYGFPDDGAGDDDQSIVSVRLNTSTSRLAVPSSRHVFQLLTYVMVYRLADSRLLVAKSQPRRTTC